MPQAWGRVMAPAQDESAAQTHQTLGKINKQNLYRASSLTEEGVTPHSCTPPHTVVSAFP